MPRSAAFTLVELLIVIALISILSAIAIPQYLGSTSDAKSAVLNEDLARIRDALERYYHQHGQTYPGYNEEEEEGDEETFIDQLTRYTDREGNTTAALDRTNYPYGPYLKKIPENPRATDGVDPDGVKVIERLTPLEPETTPQKAYLYSYNTGELISNIEE